MIYRWETKHTVINGKRLHFDGTASQLFGNWILWVLLTIITIGIYSFWLRIELKNGKPNILFLNKQQLVAFLNDKELLRKTSFLQDFPISGYNKDRKYG